jgi:hypothetical protein
LGVEESPIEPPSSSDDTLAVFSMIHTGSSHRRGVFRVGMETSDIISRSDVLGVSVDIHTASVTSSTAAISEGDGLVFRREKSALFGASPASREGDTIAHEGVTSGIGSGSGNMALSGTSIGEASDSVTADSSRNATDESRTGTSAETVSSEAVEVISDEISVISPPISNDISPPISKLTPSAERGFSIFSVSEMVTADTSSAGPRPISSAISFGGSGESTLSAASSSLSSASKRVSRESSFFTPTVSSFGSGDPDEPSSPFHPAGLGSTIGMTLSLE